jgi:IS5 family transposase
MSWKNTQQNSFADSDEDGFVKKMTYTPGNVHDSKEFYKLLGINKHKNKIFV